MSRFWNPEVGLFLPTLQPDFLARVSVVIVCSFQLWSKTRTVCVGIVAELSGMIHILRILFSLSLSLAFLKCHFILNLFKSIFESLFSVWILV